MIWPSPRYSRSSINDSAWMWALFCGLSILAIVAAGLILGGCGGGWSDADTKSAQDAAHAQLAVEEICAGDSFCKPSQVRALERMAYCNNASMLARHGVSVPDGGIVCLPK